MKKLSIILLALAFALVMAVPAMAIHVGSDQTAEGGLGITGTYKIDGQSDDRDGTKEEWYDDDFELVMKYSTGAVTAVIDLEISDDGTYDGKDVQRGNVTVPTTPPDTDTRTKLVDNYWVSYQAMDALMLKFGEYSCGFARVISTDGACGHNVQGTYSLDQADITLILSKITEGTDAGGDDGDVDETVLKVDVKEAGPFDTLAIYYNSMTDDTAAAGPEVSYTGVDLALPIGPVALAFEYGALGGDGDGNFMLAEIGLEELIGFDVGINYYQSSDDYLSAFSGNDWAPLNILGDNVNEFLFDMNLIWVTFGYDVNDKLSVNAAAAVSSENDAGDAYGSEFDIGMKYKLADNVTYQASYSSYSEGDLAGPTPSGDTDMDYTELFHRLTLKF